MNKKSFWQNIFHPDVTLPLIVIIVYLSLIAVANLIAAYFSLLNEQNIIAAGGNLLSVLLYAIPAYGLSKLKRWARITELVLSFLSVGLGMFLMFAGVLGMGVLIIVPHGLIAIYLLSEQCRRSFGLIP